jgi:hypothetical protein
LLQPAFAADPENSGQAELQRFAVAIPPRPSSQDASRIRNILEHGFRSRQTGLDAVRTEVDAARRMRSRDHRVDYAYGLVLVNHLKYDDALAAFEKSFRSGGQFFLPARQASIKLHLRLKNYAAALNDADRLAFLLENQRASWISPQSQSDGAYFLGRTIAACQLAKVDSSAKPTVEDVDRLCRNGFDSDLVQAYEEGRDSIDKDYQSQAKYLSQVQAAAQSRQEKRQEQRQAKLAKRLAEFEKRAESLKLSEREWDAWLKEQTERSEKEVERLKKDYEVLDQAAQTVQRSMLQMRLSLNVVSVVPNARMRGGNLTGRYSADFISPAMRIEEQLLKSQAQYNQIAARARALEQQARFHHDRRVAAAKWHTAATGSIHKNDTALNRRKSLLITQVENDTANAKKDVPALKGPTGRLRKISSYLRQDVKAERTRLLEEIGPAR